MHLWCRLYGYKSINKRNSDRENWSAVLLVKEILFLTDVEI